jgi:maltooligosyltrehalose synthase
MKIYALKFKDEIIKLGTSEYEVTSDYRWERKAIQPFLKVAYGTFTEEGTIELPEDKESE